jgi:CRP-like cAMP-binding protein
MARLPLVSPLDRALFLRAQPYLEELPPRVIAALAEYTEERSFAAGEVLYASGQPPDTIYFLATGSVRTEYAGADPFDIEAPGGLAFVEYLAQSDVPPGVRALEDTFALSIGARELVQLIEDDFLFYTAFARSLSRTLLQELRTRKPARRPEPGFAGPVDATTFATLDLVHRIARARNAPFFEGTNLPVMTELLRFQEPRLLKAGDVLWEQGDPVRSLALLLDGSFVSTIEHDAVVQPAGAVLGAWEIFGPQGRDASARAETAARIIEIDRSLFADVLEDHFAFAMDYLNKLATRLLRLRFGGGSAGPTPTRSLRS